MPRTPRSEVFDEKAVGIYHCTQRCVRRAFLCGEDPVTGQSFEHRKDWIRDRLEELAAIFAIDVIGYSVMGNHLHVVLRNRPDLAKNWSDREVARRWLNLFPLRRDAQGRPAEPEERELQMLTSDRKRIAELRSRLAHLSWFMRCLAENIARRVNAEEESAGRFWAGRFKCVRILDETALLVVCIYVDLNPIRAGVAATPESSRFTSAYDRIAARQDGVRRRPGTAAGRRPASSPERADGWLSPVPLEGGAEGGAESLKRRASNRGFLPIKLDDYLQLLDWTGRQVRRDKRGSIPSNLAPILERLRILPESWLQTVQDSGRIFRTAAGRAESLAAEAARRGRRTLHGVARSRAAFA
jgi:REP element-mobilizing transposase RayT